MAAANPCLNPAGGTTSTPSKSNHVLQFTNTPLLTTTILSGDLVVDILCRLPVKSILRFKSVSRRWRSVLGDPQFARMHYHHPSKADTDSLVLTAYLDSPYWTDLVSIAPGQNKCVALGIKQHLYNCIVGSAMGWICQINNKYNRFQLNNPALNLNISVFQPPYYPDGNVRVSTGFAYDHHHNGFKIFRAEQPHDFSRCFKILIYSLRSKASKYIECSDDRVKYIIGNAINIGSRLYWRILDKKPNRIVAFDLSNETFHVSSCIPNETSVREVAIGKESIALINPPCTTHSRSQIWTVSPDDELTFKQVETSWLDVHPYSADKCVRWLEETLYRVILASQTNGDILVADLSAELLEIKLFSARDNKFMTLTDGLRGWVNLRTCHIRESLYLLSDAV